MIDSNQLLEALKANDVGPATPFAEVDKILSQFSYTSEDKIQAFNILKSQGWLTDMPQGTAVAKVVHAVAPAAQPGALQTMQQIPSPTASVPEPVPVPIQVVAPQPAARNAVNIISEMSATMPVPPPVVPTVMPAVTQEALPQVSKPAPSVTVVPPTPLPPQNATQAENLPRKSDRSDSKTGISAMLFIAMLIMIVGGALLAAYAFGIGPFAR